MGKVDSIQEQVSNLGREMEILRMNEKEILEIKYKCVCVLSHIWLSVTPWTVAHQAPLSMVLFRQEYWSVLPFSPPEDLPNPSPALAEGFFTSEPPGKPRNQTYYNGNEECL